MIFKIENNLKANISMLLENMEANRQRKSERGKLPLGSKNWRSYFLLNNFNRNILFKDCIQS